MMACSEGHLEVLKYLIENEICSCKELILRKNNVRNISEVYKITIKII